MMMLRTSFFRYDAGQPLRLCRGPDQRAPHHAQHRNRAEQDPVEAAQERLAVERTRGQRLGPRADRSRPGRCRDVGHWSSSPQRSERNPGGRPAAPVDGDDGGGLDGDELGECLPLGLLWLLVDAAGISADLRQLGRRHAVREQRLLAAEAVERLPDVADERRSAVRALLGLVDLDDRDVLRLPPAGPANEANHDPFCVDVPVSSAVPVLPPTSTLFIGKPANAPAAVPCESEVTPYIALRM